jgi:radical SAM protein with 4Fe4S-binding SPASM domain
MTNVYFTQPLTVPHEDEKVYELNDSEIQDILRLRGVKTELDPGMGGVSPRVLDDLLNTSSELVSVDIALTAACNFRCIWCYRPDEEWGKDIIDFDMVARVIEQSVDLGVRFFVLTGGEPLMYKSQGKNYFDVVDKIHTVFERARIEPKVLTFTDVALINRKTAQMLAERKVGLCLKKDSLDPEIQDMIVGVKGGLSKMDEGYQNLFDVGYGSRLDLPASVNTVLAKAIFTKGGKTINTLYDDIDLHRWIRSHGMEHSIVPIHYCGEAIDETQEEGIHPLEVKALYDILSTIDAIEFNDPWRVFSAFPKNKTCNRPGRGVHIRATGKVTSCSESPLIGPYTFGNIKETRLTEIIRAKKFGYFKAEFGERKGRYICNPDICDLNRNYLCRGGCATRSAYSQIDPNTGHIKKNTNMLAYGQGREDPLCPGWIVLAQKQGVLKEGVYEQAVDNLLERSRLDAKFASSIRQKVVSDFNVLRGANQGYHHATAEDSFGREKAAI